MSAVPDDADDFLAEAAKAVDVVLARQVVTDDGEHQHQGQVGQAVFEFGRCLCYRKPTGFEAKIVRPDPGRRGQGQVPADKPRDKHLAVPVDHRLAHPWGAFAGLILGRAEQGSLGLVARVARRCQDRSLCV